jgi:hypothetical protein
MKILFDYSPENVLELREASLFVVIPEKRMAQKIDIKKRYQADEFIDLLQSMIDEIKALNA